uniref:Candidate secreted effector n=1 Tax=Meloidogyne incognita TaxID=6306 RepID=A0A914KH21_MELIC
MLSYNLTLFVIFFLFVSVAIADLTADSEGLVKQMDRSVRSKRYGYYYECCCCYGGYGWGGYGYW